MTSTSDGTHKRLPSHSFDPNLHVHHDEVTRAVNPEGCLIVSITTDFNPTLVVMEMTPVGRLNVYDAAWNSHTPIDVFVRETVRPLLLRRHGSRIHHRQFKLILSDARTQADAVAALSTMKEFRDATPIKAPSGFHQIAEIEKLLHPHDRLSIAELPLRICPEHAQSLVMILSGSHPYLVNNEGVHIPESSHPSCGLIEAFGNGCWIANR